MKFHTFVLSVVPYAWDEPTLPRELTCGIVNNGTFIHFSMDKLGEKDKIYYYNAIYIAFTHTFTKYGKYFVLILMLLRLKIIIRVSLDSFNNTYWNW